MAIALLRFPGTAYPLVPTGHEAIDRYLTELDRQLIGGAEVRKLLLVELKDHLLMSKAAAKQNGHDDTEAAEIAVRALGPIEGHAAEQRREQWRRFRRVWLAASLGYSLLGWVGALGLPSFDPLPFVPALLAAWYRTFFEPSRSLPIVSDDPDETFVTLRPEHRDLFVLVGCFSIVWLLVSGMFYVQVAGFSDARELASIGLLCIVPCLFGLCLLRFCESYELRPDEVVRLRWLRTERIPIARTVSVRRLGRIGWLGAPMSFVFRVIPDWTPWPQTVVVAYHNTNGKRRRLYIHPDAINLDQFVHQLERKIAMRDTHVTG